MPDLTSTRLRLLGQKAEGLAHDIRVLSVIVGSGKVICRCLVMNRELYGAIRGGVRKEHKET